MKSALSVIVAFATLTATVSSLCIQGERCNDEACSACTDCLGGEFQDKDAHKETSCKKCTPKPAGVHWKPRPTKECTPISDSIWDCEDGYRRDYVSGSEFCYQDPTTVKTTQNLSSSSTTRLPSVVTGDLTKPANATVSSNDETRLILEIVGGILVVVAVVIIVLCRKYCCCMRDNNARIKSAESSTPEATSLQEEEATSLQKEEEDNKEEGGNSKEKDPFLIVEMVIEGGVGVCKTENGTNDEINNINRQTKVEHPKNVTGSVKEEAEIQTLHAPPARDTMSVTAGNASSASNSIPKQRDMPEAGPNMPVGRSKNDKNIDEEREDLNHRLEDKASRGREEPNVTDAINRSPDVTVIDLFTCLGDSLDYVHLRSISRYVLSKSVHYSDKKYLCDAWIKHFKETPNPLQVIESIKKKAKDYRGFPSKKFNELADRFIEESLSKTKKNYVHLVSFLFEKLNKSDILHLNNVCFSIREELSKETFVAVMIEWSEKYRFGCFGVLDHLVKIGKETFPFVFTSREFEIKLREVRGQSPKIYTWKKGEIRYEHYAYRVFAFVFKEIGYSLFDDFLLNLKVSEGAFKMKDELNKVTSPSDKKGYTYCGVHWFKCHPGLDHISAIKESLTDIGEGFVCVDEEFVNLCNAADGSNNEEDTQCKTVRANSDGSSNEEDTHCTVKQ